MKAAVFHGPGDVRCEEIPRPVLADGEVLLRVRACGICGSDLHTYRHGMFQEILGIPAGKGRVLGHEFSGEVVETCGDVGNVRVGDRVIGNGGGANAEFVKIGSPWSRGLIRFGESIGFAEAATTEPLACSLHAVSLAEPRDEQTHVVIGAGIVGLGIVQCLKHRSSAKTIVVDLSERRLSKATELGADATIHAGKQDIFAELYGSQNLSLDRLIGGCVDTVYDCAGLSKNFEGIPVVQQAVGLVKENGNLVLVAIYEKPMELDFNTLVRKGVHVHGSWAWTLEEFTEASRLVASGEIDRKPLISHTFGLEEAKTAYEIQLSAAEAIKVVFTP